MIAYLQDKGLSIEVPDDATDDEIQSIAKDFEPHSAAALEQADPATLKDPEASLQTWKPNFYEAWIKPAAQEIGLVDIPLVQGRDPGAYAAAGQAVQELSFGIIPREAVFQTDYEKHPVATTVGALLGGLGSLMTTGAALQATKLPRLAAGAGAAGAEVLKQAPRFVPPAIMNAATFGTHTFITRTVDALQEGGVDVADFGMDVMRDTAFGGAIGAISGVASVPRAIGAAYGLGYLSSKADGGDEVESHVTGAIWGLFEAVGSFGRDKRLREAAVQNLSESIGEYVRQRRPSMSPEAAAQMGEKIVMRAASKVGGMEAVIKSQQDTLGFIESLNQQVRKAKIQVMEPRATKPEGAKPAPSEPIKESEIAPLRIEGPFNVEAAFPVISTKKTVSATLDLGLEVKPTPRFGEVETVKSSVKADDLILGRDDLSSQRIRNAQNDLAKGIRADDAVTSILVSEDPAQPGKFIVNGDGNHRVAFLKLSGYTGEVPVVLIKEAKVEQSESEGTPAGRSGEETAPALSLPAESQKAGTPKGEEPGADRGVTQSGYEKSELEATIADIKDLEVGFKTGVDIEGETGRGSTSNRKTVSQKSSWRNIAEHAWMGGMGIVKKRDINILTKAAEGKPLTEKQTARLKELIDARRTGIQNLEERARAAEADFQAAQSDVDESGRAEIIRRGEEQGYVESGATPGEMVEAESFDFGANVEDTGYYFIRVRGKDGKPKFLDSQGDLTRLRTHAARVKPENLNTVLDLLKKEGFEGEPEFIKYEGQTFHDRPGSFRESRYQSTKRGSRQFGNEADQKAQILNKLGGLEYVQKMQGPELVKMVQMLTGNVPVIKKLKASLGFMRPSGKGGIALSDEIFSDVQLWEAVLAHEIGHLMDYLPEKTMARGNILGRLASLKDYLQHTLAESPAAKEQPLSAKDRQRLRAEAERIVKRKIYEASGRAQGQKSFTDEDSSIAFSPQAILNIWNAVESEGDPALLSYIKTLNTDEKKSIIKAAMAAQKKGEKVTIKEVKQFNQQSETNPADVNKIYADLVKEEIRKRRLFEKEVIAEELKNLTKFWKPFEPIPGDSYTRYRFSSPELYADFVSVLLNAPAKAKEIAPTTYKAFWNYLEQKPEVMSALLELQSLIQGDATDLQKVRGEDILKMFERGEDAFRSRQLLLDQAKKSTLMRIRIALVDTNSPLLKARNDIAKNKVLDPDTDPKYIIEQNSMLSSFVRSYMEDLDRLAYSPAQEDGVLDDLKIMLFLDRVAVGDRENLANPLGHSPTTAKQWLDNLQKTDPERFKKASQYAQAVRDWFKNVSQIEGATDFFTPAQMSMIRVSDKYAPYRVVDYMKDYMSAGFSQQVGTFKDIGDPLTSTILKGVAVMTAIRRNQIKKFSAEFLMQNGFRAVEAKVHQYPGHFSIDQPKDPNLGVLSWKEGGKWRAVHIDKDIAKIFDQNTESINQAAGALRVILANPLFRSTYITFNMSFQAVNLFRDFMRTWANTPGLKMSQLARRYVESLPTAARRVKGEYDPIIQQMERAGALNITFNDLILGQTDETKEMEQVLARYDLAEVKQDGKWWDHPVLRPIVKVLDAVRFAGDVIETLPKVSGWKSLQSMNEQERAYWIRNLIGTPNFKRRGTLTPITNEFFLFSNIIKEGYRGFWEIGFSKSNRKNQGEYWRKRVLVSILPKVIMRLAQAGLFGAGVAVAYNKTSEYLKTSYTMVPTGFDIDNKPVMIALPSDEDGRLIGALFWKLTNMIPLTAEEAKSPKFKDWESEFKDVAALYGGQLPSVAPMAEIYSQWGAFLFGQMPRDTFRGQDILSEEQFKAGGLDAFNPMAIWTINQTGLTRLDIRDQKPDQSILKSVIEITPVAQRFIRVGDTGEYQIAKIAKQATEKKEVQARLATRRRVNKLMEEGASKADILSVAKDMEEYKNLKTAAERYERRDTLNPTSRAVESASSNNQKVAILKSAKGLYSPKDFGLLLDDLYERGNISARVYMESLDDE